jgi:hypothetical protein
MFTGNRLRFHPVVGHRFPLLGAGVPSALIWDCCQLPTFFQLGDLG